MKSCFLRTMFRLPVLLLFLLAGSAVAAGAPGTAAEEQGLLLAGAQKEGTLIIYAAIDKQAGELLTRDFTSLYPGIKVELLAMTSAEVFNSYMRDQGKRREIADLLWSSEVILQAALVKDGYAAKYHSAESAALFSWANMGDLAYTTAFEPVAMVYNKQLLGAKDLPATHKALLNACGEERFKGKIATADPEKNSLAFLLLTGDHGSGLSFWKFVKALGEAEVKLHSGYAELLDKVSAGEALFAYNVPAGEAFRRSRTDQNLGYLYHGDYTLAVPQTILITKKAPHPNAARLWIDYLLSARGQAIIAASSDLFPVRGGVAGGPITREAQQFPGGRGLKPILPAAELTRFNEKGIRRGFILKWQQTLQQVK